MAFPVCLFVCFAFAGSLAGNMLEASGIRKDLLGMPDASKASKQNKTKQVAEAWCSKKIIGTLWGNYNNNYGDFGAKYCFVFYDFL